VSRTFFLALSAVLVVPSIHAQSRPAGPRTVWPDEGPATWAPRPTVTAITANDLRTRLYQLADDSMQGRRVGEPGNFKGTAYIAREFKRLGLEPAGDDGTYFQTLPYGEAGFDRSQSRLIAGGSTLAPETDWVPLPPFGPFGSRFDVSDAPVVFAGEWGQAGSVDPATWRGKIAVFLGAPTTGFRGRRQAEGQSCDELPDRFGARMAARTDSIAAAARGQAAGRGGPAAGQSPDLRGAVGVFYVGLESLPSASVSGAFGTRGTMDRAERPGVGGAAISADAAARLFGKPADQLAVGDLGRPVTAQWTYQWTPAKAPARNVVAILRGSDPARAGEYVAVSAHNDHVGYDHSPIDHDSTRAYNWVTRRQGANDPICKPTAAQQQEIDSLIRRARSIRPVRRDSIFNGADDDGSGTVLLLEIAEKFASEHPARSILFVSHQGEEGGLLGSRWFTDHPTIPLDSVVAVHNMDMEGKGRTDYVKFGGPNSVQTLGSRRLAPEFGDIIDSVNAIRTVPMAIDKSWDVFENPLNRFCRSDQVNYVRHDIPVTYFSTGYSPDYHQVTDEPRYIEYDHSARIGNFIHDVMWAIAQRRDKPAKTGPDPRYPSC
jgi:Peptidase family M28